ncbi:MAG: hypothetical protein ABSA47_13170 [Verrucomicrobiota bacterium]|jgi:hypothetical protein
MKTQRFFSRLGLILGLGLLLPAASTAPDQSPPSETVASQNGDIRIFPINHATLAFKNQEFNSSTHHAI